VEATLLKMARNAGDKWLKTARDAFCLLRAGKKSAVVSTVQHESEERTLESTEGHERKIRWPEYVRLDVSNQVKFQLISVSDASDMWHQPLWMRAHLDMLMEL